MNKKEIRELWNASHEGAFKLREFDVSGDYIDFSFAYHGSCGCGMKVWYDVYVNRTDRRVLGYTACKWTEYGRTWHGMEDTVVPDGLLAEVEDFFYGQVIPNYTGRVPLWKDGGDSQPVENGIGA